MVKIRDNSTTDFSSWGAPTYYFEVADDGGPTRQIEVYDSGPTLRYGPDQIEDEYGRLGQSQLDDVEDWSAWAMSGPDFEDAWSAES